MQKWTNRFLDPEIEEMVRFLDPEIVEMVERSYIELDIAIGATKYAIFSLKLGHLGIWFSIFIYIFFWKISILEIP